MAVHRLTAGLRDAVASAIADTSDNLEGVSSFPSIGSIDTTPGIKRVDSQLIVVGDDGNRYSVTTDAPSVFDYSNLTPTHYFDPSATNSSGAGSFANPFTTAAQLAAWVTSLSGNMAGKILGMKRGTVARENIVLTDIYGASGDPYMIVPYGDASDRPTINLTSVSSGWSRYPDDPRIWYKPETYMQSYYQVGDILDIRNCIRYFNKNSIANLQAAGAGYSAYVGGYAYIFPFDGANPNSGGIVQTTENTNPTTSTNLVPALMLNYKDVADTGHIHVHGLRTLGARNCTTHISLKPSGTSASITTITDIIVNDVQSGMSGLDSAAYNIACDAIVIYGVNASKRLDGVLVSNCDLFSSVNNAIEVAHINNGQFKFNKGRSSIGNKMFELWQNVSNSVVAYNQSKGWGDENTFPDTTTGGFQGLPSGNRFFWQTGYGDVANTCVYANNVGNVVAFNLATGYVGAPILVGAGECKFYNNFVSAKMKAASSTMVSMGFLGSDATKYADVTLVNNAFVVREDATATDAGMVSSFNTNDILRGDNNIFRLHSTGYSSAYRFYFRNTNYTFTNWKAAVAAVTAGSQANSVNIKNSGFDLDGRPVSSLMAFSGGATMSTDFSVDLDGKPLTSKFIGPYQMAKLV